MAHFAKKIGGTLNFIDLPNDTTIDVKNYYDKYEDLTIDNFLIKYTVKSSSGLSGGALSYATSESVVINPTETYDKQSGILTITNLSKTTTTKHPADPNPGIITLSSTVSVKSIKLFVVD